MESRRLSARMRSLMQSCIQLEKDSAMSSADAQAIDSLLTQLEATVARATAVSFDPGRMITLQTITGDIVRHAAELETVFPGLFQGTIDELTSVMKQATETPATPGWRNRVCRIIKAAVEYELGIILTHYGIPDVQSVSEKLISLKDRVPSYRVTCFYKIKALVNPGAHGEDVPLIQLQDLLIEFQLTIRETKALIATKVTPKPVPFSNRRGFSHPLYKTEICRNWVASAKCPMGARCNYAHGAAEMRPMPA